MKTISKLGDVIKAISSDEKRIGGILIPFGTAKKRDLDREWFDSETKRVMEIFNVTKSLPFWVHHEQIKSLVKQFAPERLQGLEKQFESLDLESPVGQIVKLEKRPEGYWAETILEAVDKARQWYVDLVYDMVLAEKMFGSSDAWPRTVRKRQDGYIKSWVLGGGSGTPTPASPVQTDISVLKSAYKSLGILVLSDEDSEDEKSTNPEPHTHTGIIKTTTWTQNESGMWVAKASGMCETCQSPFEVMMEWNTPHAEPPLTEKQQRVLQYAEELKRKVGQ